jgi:dipeptidyl aminopeptidase/acylaminoacyl peptidase
MSEVRQDLERAMRGVWPADPGALDRQHRRQRRRTLVRRTSVFALVSFLAIALAVLLLSQWSSPVKEPVSTPTISAKTSQPTLVTIDVATGGISQVMGHVSPSSRAALSPQGSRVAFSRVFKGVEQLYVADPSGTATRLTGPGRGGCGCGAFDPTWSPDKTRIAFSGVRMDGNQDIYVVDVSSGTLHRLTRSPGMEGTATWSPDGPSRSAGEVRATRHCGS